MVFKYYFCIFIYFYYCNSSYTASIEFNFFLNQLISSMETILNFYNSNLQYFNLDGIFGLKILQGKIVNLFKV